MQDTVTQEPEPKNLKFRNSKLSHETSKKIADIRYHPSKDSKFKLYIFLGITSFEIEKKQDSSILLVICLIIMILFSQYVAYYQAD